MKAKVLCSVLGAALVALPASAAARDIVVPAGSLLTCIMDEPNFSSTTVKVGDPFLCHPRIVQMFGQVVFPRGTYLVGHLEADKDPGHFVGKGWLQLAFDRIGLPNTDLPLAARVIAVKGYRVDLDGKVIGHGHATRDAVEWLFPPLWPWKALTLPARGPRPSLKGEITVTLRLMEDVTVPSTGGPDSRLESGLGVRPRFDANPVSPSSLVEPFPNSKAISAYTPELPRVAFAKPADALAAGPFSDNYGWRRFGADPKTTLFVTNTGSVYAVAQYRLRSDVLAFVLTSGALMTMKLRDVDWATTMHLNAERGVQITLGNGPFCNGECAGF